MIAAVPSRVVFLDIDGVMNALGTCPTYDWVLKHPHHGIEPRFVERLASICRRGEAWIVLPAMGLTWPDADRAVAILQGRLEDAWPEGVTR